MSEQTKGRSAATLSESRERLQAWVDDITAVGRFERPIYKNPSELRWDCQLVLDALNHLSDDTLDQLEENLARVPR